MSDADLHSLTGAYATDALGGDERRDFERHLEQCPTCRQEVAELRATATRLAGATAVPAPPDLRARVLAEVDQVRQVSPLRATPPPAAARLPARRAPLLAAAAVAAVITLASGLVAWQQYDRANDTERRMDQVVAVLTDPDRRTVQAAGSSGGAGTVTVADGAAVVVTRGLQTLPDDRTYQLWVIEGDRARSAGLLGGDGDAQAYVDEVPPGALLGVTVEPRAGSREPTTEPVLLADMAG